MESLQIKIAIIKRLRSVLTVDRKSFNDLIRCIFRVEISDDIIKYVYTNSLNQIVKDIYDNVDIALELDNLHPDWKE